ncbi:rifin [Plasmodium reichenowi]|uniref:Rifin n=1 Tax=Plasmodium reichenowi TaxID=5854 RepID=A0A060RR81_PLARE|nr:rifin [Plasmodium reichenowi]
MKLHCSKILLFCLPLNILEHIKNIPYITTHHTATTKSRVLSECDIQSSNYNNDEEIKSVKEIFNRQTSQRFEEYEERMKDKRKKRKEERDKNIQQIIDKDKMEKSLAEKIEKGCLRCGCALGGGVLPVWGLVSGLWYATWSKYVTKMAIHKGIQKGIATVVSELQELTKSFNSIDINIIGMINAETYHCPHALTISIYGAKQNACVGKIPETAEVCTKVGERGNPLWFTSDILEATEKGIAAAKDAEKAAIATEHAKSTYLFSAIGYSVLAILIIVLVMIIIYLVLRYRRKRKMNKKAQYTKLLNQ